MSARLHFIAFFWLFSFQPVQAMGLEEIWNLIQRSKAEYSLSDKSPERQRFRLGFESPQSFTRETINHEIFQFCQKYIEKYHSAYKIPKLRSEIRNHLAETYSDENFQILLSKSTISCYSNFSKLSNYIKIDFYSDRNIFKPYHFDYVNQDGILFLTEEDEGRLGKINSFTAYDSKDCIKEITKDRNGIGGIDEWWIYKNCSLVKIEYDENENGFHERICYYSSGKQISCEGVGEKNEKVAKTALNEGKLDVASLTFKLALDEIKLELGKSSLKTCSLLKEIAAIDFQRKDYSSFGRALDEFLSISLCEKNSLDILIYKAYYDLYLRKDHKSAKSSYQKAADSYYKENGEESPELLLNLSLAQLKDQDAVSCIVSLERLNERRLLHIARFYLFYYRGSCNLLLEKYSLSIVDLKKGLEESRDKEFHPLIYYKIATAYYRLGRKSEGEPFLILAFLNNPSLLPKAMSETLFTEFFDSMVGKKIKAKYYLNQRQN